MKKGIFFFLVMLSFSVWALESEVTVLYTGKVEEFEYEAYYSCAYAREQAQRYMGMLELKDIEVSCQGGLIRPPVVAPMKLVLSFNRPVDVKKEVEINSDYLFTACALNTQIIKSLIKAIPEVSILQKRDRCSDPKNPFSYKLKLEF